MAHLMEVFVDNSSGISFQQSTNPSTKLRGIYDMREVKEDRGGGQERTSTNINLV